MSENEGVYRISCRLKRDLLVLERKHRCFLLAFIACAVTTFSFAIGVYCAPVPEVQFKHLTPDDGLSARYINFIHEDRAGFIWIGSANGLNR